MVDASSRFRFVGVGLACADPSWESLLSSEGLAWGLLPEVPTEGGAPALIVVPARTARRTRRLCHRLEEEGSALLAEVDRPTGDSVSAPQSWALPYHEDDFSGLPNADAPGAVRVEQGRVGKGEYFVLPFRLDRLWPSQRVGKKYVAVDPERDLRLWHRQAWVVKKNVRRVVVEVIRRAFLSRGLPFVQKWYWPGGSRTVFCLRTDLDGGPRENLAGFLQAAAPFAPSISIFACADRCRATADLIQNAAAAGLEVGSHTSSHMVFPEGATNQRDARRADAFLRRLGTEPVGLAAPAHFWHPSMYPPLIALGYRYACCFGLDHDNLPYYPVAGGRLQPVLEIPFHCLGDFFPKFDIALDGEVSRRFFARLIAKKHAAGEPLNLYGHGDMPGRLGAAPDLVRFLCEQALALPDVWTGHLSDLSAWWRQREAYEPGLSFSAAEDRLLCKASPEGGSAGERIMLSVHLPDGSWRLISPRQCRGPGLDVKAAPARAPLRPPAPTDVGELVRVEESSSPKTWLRRRRVAIRRLVTAYRTVYLRRAAVEGYP